MHPLAIWLNLFKTKMNNPSSDVSKGGKAPLKAFLGLDPTQQRLLLLSLVSWTIQTIVLFYYAITRTTDKVPVWMYLAYVVTTLVSYYLYYMLAI
jgi:hypothetical protein